MHRRVRIRHLLVGLALAALLITSGRACGAAGPACCSTACRRPKATLDGNGNPVISQGALGPPRPTLGFVWGPPQARAAHGRPAVDRRHRLGQHGDAFWTARQLLRALYRPDIKAKR